MLTNITTHMDWFTRVSLPNPNKVDFLELEMVVLRRLYLKVTSNLDHFLVELSKIRLQLTNGFRNEGETRTKIGTATCCLNGNDGSSVLP